ncbi:MAG: amidohydrolase, partial [Bacteroidia bacterium]
VIKRVSEYAKTHTTEWIYGRGWDQNDWNIQEFPDNTELNALFPDRPVILKRIDGHAILANAAALKRAGIHSGTKIAGGEVVLKNGKPTGLLIDNAMLAIERCVPELPDSVFSRYIKQTEMQCMALGLTSVHDCGVSTQVIQQLKKLYDSNTLNISIYALIQDQPEDISYWLKQGPLQYKGLHVGAFKIYADGALGSRGACLKKPYWDAPDQYGFMLQSPKQLEEKIKRIRTSPFQICTHAIGDSANHTILHLYQKYIASAQKKRWRIEHAQVLDFKDLTNTLWRGIIPSVQPTHALSDYLWAEKRIGIRIQGAYAYASLLRASNIIALGTDFPVEDINPLHTFIAAVFRTDAHGIPESGFRKNEAISRTQALLGMTRWAAYAAFEEQVRGSLEPGKHADFILSSVDLLQDSEAEIRQFKVASTFIKGRRMYAEK